jgi:hypothetical protein
MVIGKYFVVPVEETNGWSGETLDHTNELRGDVVKETQVRYDIK